MRVRSTRAGSATPPSPAPQSATERSHLPCRDGDPAWPDIGVRPGPPDPIRGRVLPGRNLRSEIVDGEPAPVLVQGPLAPHYPGNAYPQGPAAWSTVPSTGETVLAAAADARFNDEDAAHRVAFHLSHYGGQPDRPATSTATASTTSWSPSTSPTSTGMRYAGEVHLYYGRRGVRIDPTRHVPDIVFYGDEAGAKLGPVDRPGGDVNGDGWDDLLMSAGFHPAAGGGTRLPDAGEIYVVYGGYLQAFGCTVKVRAEDIGAKVPGLVLEGGHDGRRYTGLGERPRGRRRERRRLSDVLIGAADPYAGATARRSRPARTSSTEAVTCPTAGATASASTTTVDGIRSASSRRRTARSRGRASASAPSSRETSTATGATRSCCAPGGGGARPARRRLRLPRSRRDFPRDGVVPFEPPTRRSSADESADAPCASCGSRQPGRPAT